ncbi:MAG: SMC-Scp complex subunit ScpB [Kiritimatiellae bacterium]|nr:SMC-Scp complex subunit ScpB [Kiritimatiellia bacterium]
MIKTPDKTLVLVELKEVVASLIFASNRAVGINEIRKCISEVAEQHGQEAAVFKDIKPTDIKKALAEVEKDVAGAKSGFILKEVSGGFRFQSDHRCGPWLKVFLNRSKPNRLSRPGLETMAIIAYRQPITRAEIERIRGVGIDHVMKALLEAQLVRIVGRSELPGRPFLYGTTQLFLEHFGLKDLDGLKDRNILGDADLGKPEQRISSGHDDKEARETLPAPEIENIAELDFEASEDAPEGEHADKSAPPPDSGKAIVEEEAFDKDDVVEEDVSEDEDEEDDDDA